MGRSCFDCGYYSLENKECSCQTGDDCPFGCAHWERQIQEDCARLRPAVFTEVGTYVGTGKLSDDPEMLTSVEGGAFRKNGGKPMLSLVPQGLAEGVARVLEFGMNKYSRNNWRKGFKDSSIADSLLRHTLAYTNGEEFDPESGLCHLDHMAANVAFLLEQRRVRLAGGTVGEEDLIGCPND